jgi:hypothetical protein
MGFGIGFTAYILTNRTYEYLPIVCFEGDSDIWVAEMTVGPPCGSRYPWENPWQVLLPLALARNAHSQLALLLIPGIRRPVHLCPRRWEENKQRSGGTTCAMLLFQWAALHKVVFKWWRGTQRKHVKGHGRHCTSGAAHVAPLRSKRHDSPWGARRRP